MQAPDVVTDHPERGVQLSGDLAGAGGSILERGQDPRAERMGERLGQRRVSDVLVSLQLRPSEEPAEPVVDSVQANPSGRLGNIQLARDLRMRPVIAVP